MRYLSVNFRSANIIMKKLLLLVSCLTLLAACGQELSAEDVAGAWENGSAQVYLGEDGSYEIKYADPKAGELASESGKFQLDGGKILLQRRDRYRLNDLGETEFRRLMETEDRKLDVSLDGDALTLDGEEYQRRPEG